MSDLIPITNLSFPYASGCLVQSRSATSLDIAVGQVRDSTDTFDIQVNPDLIVSTTFNGAGGLDTGTIANNRMYSVFVLYDPTNTLPVSSLLSLSSTAPVLPSVNGTTYGAFRLVGFWLTNGSAQILSGYTCGVSNTRYFQYDIPITVVSAGASASANVDLSVGVPLSNFGNVKFQASYTPHAAGDAAGFRPVGAASSMYNMAGLLSGFVQSDLFEILPDINTGKPEITYTLSSTVSPAALSLWIVGYDFYI